MGHGAAYISISISLSNHGSANQRHTGKMASVWDVGCGLLVLSVSVCLFVCVCVCVCVCGKAKGASNISKDVCFSSLVMRCLHHSFLIRVLVLDLCVSH